MYRPLLKHVPELVGIIFVFAAMFKLLHPGQATVALESLDVPYELASAIVFGVITIEFYLGVLLIAQIDSKYALASSMGLMFVFTVYLWYLSMLARPPSCGCLGLTGVFNSNKQEALFGLFRNCAILWALKLSYDHNFRFISGAARETKSRGLKLVWSNEMMFPFKGEAEAAKEGLIDRVLFVSEFQEKVFADIYRDVPSLLTGNYIDPDDYAWRERRNPVFTLGRLSRPDPTKYPLDFPAFYEELGVKEVRYRVMAWSNDLKKQYRWHHFGPEWDLLPENKEPALHFLYSLDVFLYPLGHRVKESWGRAAVEAMLTGCVPVVPDGHQFHKLMVHGESGFVCHEYREFKAVVRELYENYPLRKKISGQCSRHAREHLCNPEDHRRKWIEALSF